jgi:membrane protein DedA with SNARE-associated domain
MLEAAVHWIVEIVEVMGYPGVFVMSALESTFLPIPSEITLIPAGYLIHQGVWSGPLVFLLATLGTLTGSLANYALAFYGGRYVLVRYGRYFLMTEEKLLKMEGFFVRHGPLSIFLGRLVMGVRHFISFPAGLARMNLKKFCFYTMAGGAIWTFILLLLGYAIGDNKEFVMEILPAIKAGFAVAVVAVIAFVFYKHRRKAA